jgi:hypothetical protein
MLRRVSEVWVGLPKGETECAWRPFGYYFTGPVRRRGHGLEGVGRHGLVAEGHDEISYSGYRFPPEIIHQAIWLYFRFRLSFRNVEDLLAERGIAVSYETVRCYVSLAPVGSLLDLRISNFAAGKPSNLGISTERILTLDGFFLLHERRSWLLRVGVQTPCAP